VNEALFFPKGIVMGTKVRLRSEAFKDMRVREWRFSGVEKGKLVLFRPEGHILRVEFEDIDWKEQNKPKIED
jgi:hypothetical protein